MEEKRSSVGFRSKRTKQLDEGQWECSVCTYRNSPEAFKCDMCDVRKGTSTRKPRINPQLVAQQVAQQYAPPPKKEKCVTKKEKGGASTSDGQSQKHEFTNYHKKNRPPRLKNIDRSSGHSMEVTVGNVTVIITDYQPKREKTATVTLADTQNSCPNQSDSGESSISMSSSELLNGEVKEEL